MNWTAIVLLCWSGAVAGEQSGWARAGPDRQGKNYVYFFAKSRPKSCSLQRVSNNKFGPSCVWRNTSQLSAASKGSLLCIEYFSFGHPHFSQIIQWEDDLFHIRWDPNHQMWECEMAKWSNYIIKHLI